MRSIAWVYFIMQSFLWGGKRGQEGEREEEREGRGRGGKKDGGRGGEREDEGRKAEGGGEWGGGKERGRRIQYHSVWSFIIQ